MNQIQLERKIEMAQQRAADLRAVLGRTNGEIERLQSEVAAELTGADLEDLGGRALAQAQADVELAAQRRVAAEIKRRLADAEKEIERLETQLRRLILDDLQLQVDALSDQIMVYMENSLPMLDALQDLLGRGAEMGRTLDCHVLAAWRRPNTEWALDRYKRDRWPQLYMSVSAEELSMMPVKATAKATEKATATAPKSRRSPILALADPDDPDDGEWTATAPGM